MKPHVRVETDDGQVLEFTQDDVTAYEVSTPYGVEDITPPDSEYAVRRLTTPRFRLDATFTESDPPRWVDVHW